MDRELRCRYRIWNLIFSLITSRVKIFHRFNMPKNIISFPVQYILFSFEVDLTFNLYRE